MQRRRVGREIKLMKGAARRRFSVWETVSSLLVG